MKKLIVAICLMASALNCAEIGQSKVNPSSIRIVPVDPTPESNNVTTTINFPKAGQYSGQPVSVQIRLFGFPLGIISPFERKNDLYGDPSGQSMRVIIDNYPYLSIYNAFLDSLENSSLYYDQNLTTKVPFDLEDGVHILRTFPVRSYGESLKGQGCYAATVFYTGQGEGSIDLKAPYLTYNMPQGQIPYKSGQAVLLDFYLSNVSLSRDGYKVQVTIDGHAERMLTSWVPYYIYGLSQGTHTVRLELLDGQNRKVPGMLGEAEKEITLY